MVVPKIQESSLPYRHTPDWLLNVNIYVEKLLLFPLKANTCRPIGRRTDPPGDAQVVRRAEVVHSHMNRLYLEAEVEVLDGAEIEF